MYYGLSFCNTFSYKWVAKVILETGFINSITSQTRLQASTNTFLFDFFDKQLNANHISTHEEFRVLQNEHSNLNSNVRGWCKASLQI
jgi:hypothetical protein